MGLWVNCQSLSLNSFISPEPPSEKAPAEQWFSAGAFFMILLIAAQLSGHFH
jgi:hypothetical protein